LSSVKRGALLFVGERSPRPWRSTALARISGKNLLYFFRKRKKKNLRQSDSVRGSEGALLECVGQGEEKGRGPGGMSSSFTFGEGFRGSSSDWEEMRPRACSGKGGKKKQTSILHETTTFVQGLWKRNMRRDLRHLRGNEGTERGKIESSTGQRGKKNGGRDLFDCHREGKS